VLGVLGEFVKEKCNISPVRRMHRKLVVRGISGADFSCLSAISTERGRRRRKEAEKANGSIIMAFGRTRRGNGRKYDF